MFSSYKRMSMLIYQVYGCENNKIKYLKHRNIKQKNRTKYEDLFCRKKNDLNNLKWIFMVHSTWYRIENKKRKMINWLKWNCHGVGQLPNGALFCVFVKSLNWQCIVKCLKRDWFTELFVTLLKTLYKYFGVQRSTHFNQM